MAFLRKHWPVLLIVLAALVALAPALKPGSAIGPWDDLRAMMDGGPTPRPFDVLQMDAVLQFYGWRDLVFESWGNFEPPFWNPYQLMGTPLLANSQSGGFYPLHIVLGVLHVPTAVAILLLAWFHLAWSGLGVRALVLRMGGSTHGAAVGGAMFAVCPFLLSWVGLASVPTTCAWIPWALAFCHDVFNGSRNRWRSCGLLGACLAMMLLGGHLQFSAYGFMAIAVFAAWQSVATKMWSGFGLALVGCVLGGLLAAPQVVPVLEYSKFSHRQNTPTEEGYGFYVRGAVKPIEAAGVVFPDVLGTPGRAAPGDGPVKLGSFWPAYTKIGGNYAESAIYLGPAVLFLLALAVFRRGWRSAGAAGAVGAFGLLLSLGTPLNKLLYFYFPGWSATGSPGRASFLFVLAACALAGWAWPREGEAFCVRKPTYILLALSAVTLALVALAAPGLPAWNLALQEVIGAAVSANIAFVLPIALVALALTIGGAFALEKGNPIFACLAFIAATAVVAGPRLVPVGEPLPRGVPNPNERTAFVNSDWQLLVGLPVVQPPNTATIERKLDVAGYDSLIHRDTFRILNEINGRDSAPEANGNMTLIKPDYDAEKLAEAGVTSVLLLGRTPTTLSGTQTISARAIVFDHVTNIEGTYTSQQSVHVASDDLASTIVPASGPGTLKLRDRNMPGWTATVDGAPAEIGGTDWREVQLPAGEHTVVFIYTPPGLRTGLICLFAGLVSLVCIQLLGRRKQPQ
jgi:hypothetical protein